MCNGERHVLRQCRTGCGPSLRLGSAIVTCLLVFVFSALATTAHFRGPCLSTSWRSFSSSSSVHCGPEDMVSKCLK